MTSGVVCCESPKKNGCGSSSLQNFKGEGECGEPLDQDYNYSPEREGDKVEHDADVNKIDSLRIGMNKIQIVPPPDQGDSLPRDHAGTSGFPSFELAAMEKLEGLFKFEHMKPYSIPEFFSFLSSVYNALRVLKPKSSMTSVVHDELIRLKRKAIRKVLRSHVVLLPPFAHRWAIEPSGFSFDSETRMTSVEPPRSERSSYSATSEHTADLLDSFSEANMIGQGVECDSSGIVWIAKTPFLCQCLPQCATSLFLFATKSSAAVWDRLGSTSILQSNKSSAEVHQYCFPHNTTTLYEVKKDSLFRASVRLRIEAEAFDRLFKYALNGAVDCRDLSAEQTVVFSQLVSTSHLCPACICLSCLRNVSPRLMETQRQCLSCSHESKASPLHVTDIEAADEKDIQQLTGCSATISSKPSLSPASTRSMLTSKGTDEQNSANPSEVGESINSCSEDDRLSVPSFPADSACRNCPAAKSCRSVCSGYYVRSKSADWFRNLPSEETLERERHEDNCESLNSQTESDRQMSPGESDSSQPPKMVLDYCPLLGQSMGLESAEDPVPPSLTQFVKTRMCAQFKNGKCMRRPDVCKFAHSLQELRSTTDVFKTQLCAFWMAGHCKAGPACRHAHGSDELRIRSEGADLGKRKMGDQLRSQTPRMGGATGKKNGVVPKNGMAIRIRGSENRSGRDRLTGCPQNVVDMRMEGMTQPRSIEGYPSISGVDRYGPNTRRGNNMMTANIGNRDIAANNNINYYYYNSNGIYCESNLATDISGREREMFQNDCPYAAGGQWAGPVTVGAGVSSSITIGKPVFEILSTDNCVQISGPKR